MPAVSAKQKKLMDAAAHNPDFATKAGISTTVAQEFSEATKGKRFGPVSRTDLQGINKPKTDHGKSALFKKGGEMKSDMKQDKAMVKKAVGMHDKQMHGGKKTDMATLKKGGTLKMAKGGGIESKGKTKGKMITMKSGGKSC
jgi:hypothetical protein